MKVNFNNFFLFYFERKFKHTEPKWWRDPEWGPLGCLQPVGLILGPVWGSVGDIPTFANYVVGGEVVFYVVVTSYHLYASSLSILSFQIEKYNKFLKNKYDLIGEP